MAPFDLQGLNVVHDAQDVAAPSPDFSAHLDLWTNLPFESDEPLASPHLKRKLPDDQGDNPNQDTLDNTPTAPNPPIAPPFDINALLAGFGINPLLMPATPPAPVQQNTQPVPSLAQLLALQAAYSGVPPSTPTATPPSDSPPKRVRTQKSTVPDPLPLTPQSPEESDTGGVTLSAAEDKRRRNTAASARFRLKKKEREAALERRAKELEERVVELERECEALRRENGWLKGLVVGVTGAGAAQHQASAK